MLHLNPYAIGFMLSPHGQHLHLCASRHRYMVHTHRVVSWFSSSSKSQRASNIGSEIHLGDAAYASELRAPFSGSEAPSGSGPSQAGESFTTTGTGLGRGGAPATGSAGVRLGSGVGGLPKGRGDPILEAVRKPSQRTFWS